MATRRIRRFDDPFLRRPAEPVTDFDAELRALVADLRDTMMDAGGDGLAAPQIGVGLRVFTYLGAGEVQHLVNPVVTTSSAEIVVDDEGCLSFPVLWFPVPRPARVVVTGWNVHGDPIALDTELRLARCLQHEIDHLDGILFVDRMNPEEQAAAMRLVREAAEREEPVPRVQVSPHPARRDR